MKKILCVLALGLAGCASNYRYLFAPSPAEVVVQPGQGGPIARALITVLRGERDSGRSQMHLRLRIENRSESPVRLAPESLQLVGSDLAEFGTPRVEPGVTEVPPGEVHTYDVRFPFPPGLSLSAPNLDGLVFAWRLDYADGAAEISTTFQRRFEETYAADPRVTWSFGFGYYR